MTDLTKNNLNELKEYLLNILNENNKKDYIIEDNILEALNNRVNEDFYKNPIKFVSFEDRLDYLKEKFSGIYKLASEQNNILEKFKSFDINNEAHKIDLDNLRKEVENEFSNKGLSDSLFNAILKNYYPEPETKIVEDKKTSNKNTLYTGHNPGMDY
jgi:uncharacterized membrane protein YheB (UPF0754 family)